MIRRMKLYLSSYQLGREPQRLRELVGPGARAAIIMNATDMFAAITALSIVGVVLVYLCRLVERRALHWSSEFRKAS